MNGRGAHSEQAKAVARLSAEVAERDQVIGELTIANRVLEKLSGALSRAARYAGWSRPRVSARRSSRLSRVLKALGVARSVWYARRKSEPKRPGRKRKPVPEALAEKVRAVAGCASGGAGLAGIGASRPTWPRPLVQPGRSRPRAAPRDPARRRPAMPGARARAEVVHRVPASAGKASSYDTRASGTGPDSGTPTSALSLSCCRRHIAA